MYPNKNTLKVDHLQQNFSFTEQEGGVKIDYGMPQYDE